MGGVGRYKLEEFLQGRKCPEVFHLVLEKFVPAVVGRRLYRKRLKVCPRDDNGLFSASDEAFMLLLLENSWNRWVDIYLNTAKTVIQARSNCLQSRTWKFVSDEPTLYTAGGIRYKHGKEVRATNGWTAEGVKRYNALFRIVKRDRAENPSIFREWVDDIFDSDEINVVADREKGAGTTVGKTAIDSDLFQELGVAVGGNRSGPSGTERSTTPVEEDSDVEEWDDAMCDSDSDDSG